MAEPSGTHGAGDALAPGADAGLISIVVPCFNESPNLEAVYRALYEVCESARPYEFELIFVDDGSSDDTVVKLHHLADADRRIRTIELSRNFGKEAALTAGIEHARGRAVIPIDADLQDPPALILKMIDAWRNGAEVVLARRIERSGDGLLKRKTAGLFYWLHNRISGLNLPENVGDFRLIDRIAIDALAKLPERQRFMKGLFSWVGFRTVTIDYSRPARHLGKSKFSGWRLLNFAIEGITSFSIAPLKVWTYVGATLAGCTLVYAGYIVVRTLVSGRDLPGYASLLVAVLFLGSLQLISIGVLGEYIGRIYMESKQRPVYLVRRLYSQDRDGR